MPTEWSPSGVGQEVPTKREPDRRRAPTACPTIAGVPSAAPSGNHMQNRPQIRSGETSRRAEQHIVSDDALLRRFVSPQMMSYFQLKMPELGREVLTRRVCELLKFLILVRFSPGRILFGKEIDEIWHFWILQTREYAELCKKLPGRSFRHHSSTAYDQGSASAPRQHPGEAVERILSFFISYYRNFGPVPEDRIDCWPTLRQVMQEAGWDLAGMNEFLREQAFARAA
jgi:hypothetical protein